MKRIHNIIDRNQEKARLYEKEHYDKKAGGKSFQVGDQVMLYNPAIKLGESKKFSPPYNGPYIITEQHGETNFTIVPVSSNKLREQTVHQNRLKKSYSAQAQQSVSEEEIITDNEDSDDDDDIFIVAQETTNAKMQDVTTPPVPMVIIPNDVNGQVNTEADGIQQPIMVQMETDTNIQDETNDPTYVPNQRVTTLPRRTNPPRTRQRPARYNAQEFDINSLTVTKNTTGTREIRHSTGTSLHHLFTLALLFVLMQATNTAEVRKISTQEDLGKLFGPAHVCGASGHHAIYIEIPDIPPCVWDDPRSKAVENVLTTPFFPKSFSDPIKAYACQVEIEFIRTSMGFWGTKSVLNRGREYRKLNINDCFTEARNMNNGVSQLKEVGHNIFSNDTSQLTEEYHWCREHLIMRYRIIFKQIKIRFNYHNRKIVTSSFSTEDCSMDRSYCELPTVTMVWQANINDTCPLKEGSQVLGQCLGNKELTKFTVVSEVEQFAVSGYRKSIKKCEFDLYETQEGIFLRIDQSNITASMAKVLLQHEHHQTQTTSELSLISFVARELEDLVYDLYRKTWLNICHLTQQRLIWIKQLANNPQQAYIAARILMRTENLMAHSAGQYLSAYECDIIESYYLDTTSKCYKSIPIKYSLYEKEFKRFLIATTKDIIPLDADLTCEKPIQVFLKEVNKTTGQIYIWNGSTLLTTVLNNTVSIQLLE